MAEIPLVSAAGQGADRMEREAAPWVERLARLGYAAKGIVYLVVGGLAVRAAVGNGGGSTGSEGALESIARQPMGKLLVGLLAVGLVGYALWRVVQALRDPEHQGRGAKGLAKRSGYGVSALIHAALAVEAVRLAMGSGQGDESESGVDRRVAWLMEQPFGPWMVMGVGLVILAFGFYEMSRAYRSDVAKRLHLGSLEAETRRWVVRSGRVGYAARGVVFAVIGFFLVQAGRHYDAEEARGLAGALRWMEGGGYGTWLFGGIAVGLMAYGFFCLVEARYRQIRPAD